MATHSSSLAWKIAWTEEPDRLQSLGSQRIRTRLSDFTFTFAMARTSDTMINRNGERDFIDLYLIAGEKLSAFPC